MCCILLNSNILCLTFFPFFPQWKKFVGEIISVVVNFLPNFLEDFKHNEVHLFRVRGIDFKIHAKLKAWLLVFHITCTNSISNVKAFLKSKMCNFIRMKEDEKQKKIFFSLKHDVIFADIFGQRIGRVSPRIREIQEQLREAQRKSAMKKYVEVDYVDYTEAEFIWSFLSVVMIINSFFLLF